ncbi:MAG: hypothetical protein JSV52_07865 [Candidatus Zixiibacteriota bacterium]|nr:MAG: hypothetical protein JSV52_07865 [candidate division Zixibacteria bacterium]
MMRIVIQTLVLVLVLTVSVSGQNVTVNNDLVFGSVFPGIPKTITKYTAGSACEFQITGTAGAEITIDLTLPTYMNAGGFSMQLIFSETDCAIDTAATPDQSSPEFDDLDPWHTLTYRLGSNGLTLWLGGIVVPALRQQQGSYSASIVITVQYTGS